MRGNPPEGFEGGSYAKTITPNDQLSGGGRMVSIGTAASSRRPLQRLVELSRSARR